MAADNQKDDAPRPRPVHISRSFTRLAPTPEPLNRSHRANTLQPRPLAHTSASGARSASNPTSDPLSQPSESKMAQQGDGLSPETSDDLPIELASLADSFVESLLKPVHNSPPSAEKMSERFQDFYVTAANHIETHISTLSSRQRRADSPAPSASTNTSAASKFRAKAMSIGVKERPKEQLERNDTEQQMLTTEEIAKRKRARKDLEVKRVVLEEAIERRVCEKIYSRIWRHRSTQDEAKDEQLRSKTAALSVVGIGLSDLGIELGDANETEEAKQNKEQEIRKWLEPAREELYFMNDERYPLGKLRHLEKALKSIVETLAQISSSSSADEIMPMLIYTLITSPPEGIDVISNLYFIQRFRSESKVDGEAAYCLTTLEAAITFLETVDLSSLRANEIPSGPLKSQPTTPGTERPPTISRSSTSHAALSAPAVNPVSVDGEAPSLDRRHTAQVPTVGAESRNRRLSFAPAQAFGAASDAVLNTADQSLKNIGNSLGDSYKFLIGKLSERHDNSPGGKKSPVVVPRTLEDARKLVGTPPPEEEEGSAPGIGVQQAENATEKHPLQSVERQAPPQKATVDDKLAALFGHGKIRDRSADSNLSSNSGNKKALFAETPSPANGREEKEKGTSSAGPSTNPLEQIRNMGSSLNPMNRISSIGFPRGFGRSVTTPVAAPPLVERRESSSVEGVPELATAFPDIAASLPPKPPKETPKIAPPIKRFMEVQNPGELRINEVLELLRDYRRLAGALKDLGAV